MTLPSEPTLVDGDSTRLAQVVSNLLNNAAKYTDDGGRIVISIERTGPPDNRLLVVDDNRDAAESMALLLQLDGHDVRTLHDGKQAVDAALAERPDVILLDIGLPYLNGYDACRMMRAGGLKDTVIIALTGYGQRDDRRQSFEAGFDAHCVKPLAMNDLRAILARRTSRAA